MTTIRQYLTERISEDISRTLIEQNSDSKVCIGIYLKKREDEYYDDLVCGKFSFGSGDRYIDLKYTEIKRGVTVFGTPAAYFVTEIGLIQYSYNRSKNHILQPVKEVLTSNMLKNK